MNLAGWLVVFAAASQPVTVDVYIDNILVHRGMELTPSFFVVGTPGKLDLRLHKPDPIFKDGYED